MVEDGWSPVDNDAENVTEKLSIEEVFSLVDINKSGYVSKTVKNFCSLWIPFARYHFYNHFIFTGNQTGFKILEKALWNDKCRE